MWKGGRRADPSRQHSKPSPCRDHPTCGEKVNAFEQGACPKVRRSSFCRLLLRSNRLDSPLEAPAALMAYHAREVKLAPRARERNTGRLKAK